MTSSTPAFKEWSVIVDALAAGKQILILRKGGIAEGRDGFAPGRASRFWLFPTLFHAQLEKIKSDAPTGSLPTRTPPLRAYAETVRHAHLTDWNAVRALEPFHLWTEETIRERFNWSRECGIHVFTVRVHRLIEPITLTPDATMAGCKSWIELPYDFAAHPAVPALDDASFARLLAELPLD